MRKHVLSLVIAGVFLAAIGVGLWVDANNLIEQGSYLRAHGHSFQEWNSYVARKSIEEAIGAGLAVIGGSMAVAGGVMVARRSEDTKHE